MPFDINLFGRFVAAPRALGDGERLRLPFINRVGAATVAPSAVRADASNKLPHRNAITVIDKLGLQPTVTPTSVTEAGSVLTNAIRYAAVCAGNRWGAAGQAAPTIVNTTPTANQAVRLAFAAVANAEWYDIFLGTSSTSPTWVGRITEAQRQVGGIFSSVGVYTPPGVGAVNSIDVGIDGTGLGVLSAPFSSNNAYTPQLVVPYACAGYSRLHALVKLAVTDLRSLPTLSIIPFLSNQGSAVEWCQGALQTVNLLTGVGQSQLQDFEIDVDGATQVLVLVDTIAGQGAAATVWLEAA